MKSHSIEDALLVRYLLGQLNEAEAEQIEKDYFDDDQFYEHLEVVEDELIDAYVRGRLSAEERKQFEKYFLRDAERRQRVEFAREWKTFVARSSATVRPREERARQAGWLERLLFGNRAVLVPVAAAVLLALGGVWLAMNTFSLNHQLDEMRAERAAQEKTAQELQRQVAEERGRREQLLARLESERSRRELEDRIASASPLPIIASFMLSPGLSRDAGDARRFLIPSEATQLRLQVMFKVGDFKSYRAELQTIEGRIVWSERGLKARPKGGEQMVLVTIPANRLKDEDYILILKGITPAGELSDVSEYSFRVIR